MASSKSWSVNGFINKNLQAASSLFQLRDNSPQATNPARPRIVAINLARVVIVAAVISTHIMAAGPLYASSTSGVIWMISHTSRNLFILISALVLMYNYGNRRPFNLRSFYIKRFTLVFIPYAVWSLIYQWRYSSGHAIDLSFLTTFGYNLLTAKAMYHLYFLLVTMQIYLLFPIIRLAYHKVAAYPWHILAISFIVQLLTTAFIQYGPPIHGLEWWLNSPDNYLMSYQLYIVMGLLIASHVGLFEQLLQKYATKIYLATPIVSTIGLAFYFVQIAYHVSPVKASAVFQPYLVIESVIFTLALFAVSFQWSQRGAPKGRIISMVAEDSFGIYLGHLWVASYLMTLQPPTNDWLTAIASLLIGLPLIYAITFSLTELVRHTWFSLLLTGRHMNQATKRNQAISKATLT